VVFELFALSEPVWTVQNRSTRSHIGEERVATRSRTDHGAAPLSSLLVIGGFYATAESKRLACLCESYHRHIVTWTTWRLGVLPSQTPLKSALRAKKSQDNGINGGHWHTGSLGR
jgi:hypothetical protein